MAEYDNNNTFVLFKNDKGDNERRPDYTGTITLEDGKEMNLSAWIRTSKDGKKFFSGAVSEKKNQQQRQEATVADLDDIPF